MDESILLYVFGRGAHALTPEQTAAYKLAADEPEAPASTLSDWHTKGLKKLADALDLRDRFLASQKPRPRRRFPKAALIVILLALAAFLVWGGVKVNRVYRLASLVWQEASELRGQAGASPSLETARAVGPPLEKLRVDFRTLSDETRPFLRFAPSLGWVPVYGGDLASAPDLLALADALLATAGQTYAALTPLLDAYESETFDPGRMTALLNEAQPQLAEARLSLDLARAARTRLDPTQLSPRARGLLDDVDRLLPLLDDSLMLAQEAPRLLGASADGPKTYLLLAQNEDELRPSGGFITAAATLLVRDGRILSLAFQNSSDFDNWQKPYPRAPWQLQQYMNSPALVFRDSNWFTDFRTSSLYAEYLYSYANNHSVDGVIAFDQHVLVELLRIVGPIQLDGQIEPVSADNVIAFMRAEKSVHTETPFGVTNKAFINDITAALMHKLFSGGIPPYELGKLLPKLLNEKHILVQLDDPLLSDFIVRRGWDGALRAGDGDFLMAVDSNIGFNKTSALVQTSLAYDVDLTDPAAPRAQLVVSHQNGASSQVPCISYPYLTAEDLKEFTAEKDYPLNRCYYDYLRVYTLAGTELLSASVQAVPAEWTIRRRAVPPQVDVLDEKLDGLRGFGTFKVIPGGESLASSFRFALPVSVLTRGADARQMAYRLKVQKEPGTIGVAVAIRLHLPNGATVRKVPPGAVVEGTNILLQSALVTDLQLEFVFLIP